MAATTAVRQAVWNGSLPLNIVLAENEARSNTRHEYLVSGNIFVGLRPVLIMIPLMFIGYSESNIVSAVIS